MDNLQCMSKKSRSPLKTLLVISLSLVFGLNTANAQVLRGIKRPTSNIAYVQTASVPGTTAPTIGQTQPQNADIVDCSYASPEKTNFSGRTLSIRKKGLVAIGEAFEVNVLIKNTGNVPWFSVDSGCSGSGNIVNLGTAREHDRKSLFFMEMGFGKEDWLSAQRIKMDSKRVNPNEIASFSFWAKAPNEKGLYREFFAPVVEGKSWIDSAIFYADIRVGTIQIDPKKEPFFSQVQRSTELTKLEFKEPKSIEIDISEQKMRLKIGNEVIRTFRVSTGTYRTPTPLGTFPILSKQPIRVASSKPHYIMPKFMLLTRGGVGIHSLPSLGRPNGGIYWREALNHIGTRRSHGCIRLLPQDSEFAYAFAEVGTIVKIVN
jgi:hypothetical protein